MSFSVVTGGVLVMFFIGILLYAFFLSRKAGGDKVRLDNLHKENDARREARRERETRKLPDSVDDVADKL